MIAGVAFLILTPLQQARALYQDGRISESIAILKRLPPNRETDEQLALDYCAINDERNARLYLQHVRRDPANQLAPCLLQTGDYAAAYAAFSNGPANADTLVGTGRALIGISKQALADLEQLPGNTTYMRALESARTGSGPSADAALNDAYSSAPYVRSGDPIGTLLALQRTHNHEAAFQYILGIRTGQEAIATVAVCQERYPSAPALLRWEAEMAAEQGDMQKATQLLETAAQNTPPSFELQRDLGLVYFRMHDFDKALAEFQTMLHIKPDSEEAKVAVSRCLMQLGRYADDADLLKPLLERPNPPSWVLLDWAVLQTNLSHPDQAIGAIRRLLKRDPADASLHYRLAKLYQTTGDKASADREFVIFRRLPKPRDASPGGN